MNGDNFNQLLLLGDLVVVGECFDVNSNNQLDFFFGGFINYSNQYSGSFLVDVYYSFLLSDVWEVIFFIDYVEIVFDIYLFFLDVDGNLLVDNDDVVFGNL